MQISMYRASVPVFARNLRNLGDILRKGEAHALAAQDRARPCCSTTGSRPTCFR